MEKNEARMERKLNHSGVNVLDRCDGST